MEDKIPRKPRILLAPLDWGLGHTTRCIPLVRQLLEAGAVVSVAGNAVQATIFSTEFPGIQVFSLPGYEVRYAHSAAGLLWNMITQAPKILRAIRREKEWLQQIMHSERFDAVISDNRYGFYHGGVPSVFITHQLLVKTPFGHWSDRLLQKRNYRYINQFTECWVADLEGSINLAGDLSHPSKKPAIPVYYTGLLSRLKRNNGQEIKDHLFITLSGPEPQRTMLEDKIVEAIAHYKGSAVIVRGLPNEEKMIPSTNSIRFYNHLSAQQFNEELNKAEYVIGRTGYSTVMDVMVTGKKAILIPTPGQTEQEYLAKHCMQNHLAYCISQKEFSLNGSLQEAKSFTYKTGTIRENPLLNDFIVAFLQRLDYKSDLG